MNFNGQVGNLGDKASTTTYEVSYRGADLRKLREFVLKRCREKGLEVLEVKDEKEKEGFKVTARVKSLVGIV